MTLKRKIVLWSVVGLVCLFAGVTALERYFASRDSAKFMAQIRLARAEGLPTNAAEFAATIKPAKADENAASDYRSMGAPFPTDGPRKLNPTTAEWMLLNQPSPASLKAARAILLATQSPLAFMDAATKKPRCWFDRNWNDGPAVEEPELNWIRDGASLLALRGAVELAEGNDDAAIANAEQILQLSKHAGEEGTPQAALLSRQLFALGLKELAALAFVHPIRPYADALNKAIADYPRPDARAENRGKLFFELRGIELLETPEGRRKLGFGPDDRPDAGDVLASSFFSQPVAKVAILKAERDYWAALKLPPNQREPKLSDAENRIDSAAKAFPWLQNHYAQEPDVSGIDKSESDWEVRRLEYTAIARALAGGGRAKTIKTDDLKSPYDGLPLRYSFDGKQISIQISEGKSAGWTKMLVPEKKPG